MEHSAIQQGCRRYTILHHVERSSSILTGIELSLFRRFLEIMHAPHTVSTTRWTHAAQSCGHNEHVAACIMFLACQGGRSKDASSLAGVAQTSSGRSTLDMIRGRGSLLSVFLQQQQRQQPHSCWGVQTSIHSFTSCEWNSLALPA